MPTDICYNIAIIEIRAGSYVPWDDLDQLDHDNLDGKSYLGMAWLHNDKRVPVATDVNFM
jgi:hypothetical protein